MKKIYYLLALIAIAFTACKKQPLISTGAYTKSLTITLAKSDYQSLGNTVYSSKSFNFNTTADAKTYIPTILNTKYPQLGDGSVAIVTFSLAAPSIILADSTNANTAYSLTIADYALLPGNKFTDFSTAQILSWLPYKFPSPVNNQLAVLSYTYFESGATSFAGVPATDAFLYTNGSWQKIYRVSAAQYTSVGRGVNNWFIATDVPTITFYINSFLKADTKVMAAAQVGSVIYVNYRYLTTYQKIMPLTFDGSNWVNNATPSSFSFLKSGGNWAPDNTVFYTMVQADYTTISTSTVGTQPARDNIAKFPDFNISASTDPTYWADIDIQNGILFLVKAKYSSIAVANQKFVITYAVYNSGVVTNRTKTYQYDGTNFNFIP
jgi:hypothetical protein